MASATEIFSSPLERWFSQDDRRNLFDQQLDHDIEQIVAHCQHLHHPYRNQPASTLIDDYSEYDDSMANDYVPALTRGNSVASTSSAASTGMASRIDGGLVDEPEDGIIRARTVRQRPEDLLCPFEILGCDQVFSSVRDFKTHVFSHFRGHPLPTVAVCFGCSHVWFQRPDDDNALAWNSMLTHMTYDHYRSGQTEITLRPDVFLMRYMWNRKIITDAEFKETQAMPRARSLRSNRPQDNMESMMELPVAPSASVPLAVQQYHRSHLRQGDAVIVQASRRNARREAARLMASM